jgi:hypothetical protein
MSRVPPPFLERLIDDAAVFPPGNSPLPEAVAAHRATRVDPFRSAVTGPLVLGAAALPELEQLADPTLSPALDVLAVVPAPDDVAAVLHSAGHGWEIVGVDVKVADTATAEDALATIADAVAGHLPTAAVGVEFPWPSADPAGWRAALRATAATGMKVKLRTGGTTADAFPSVALLADAITVLADAGARFKCTAGLHSAIRHVDGTTGFAHHGFVNILVATTRALTGGTPVETAAILASEDGALLARALRSISADQIAATRAAFTSYGSCSIDEPLDDLERLGLLAAAAAKIA